MIDMRFVSVVWQTRKNLVRILQTWPNIHALIFTTKLREESAAPAVGIHYNDDPLPIARLEFNVMKVIMWI